ncbi:MAG TPA: HAMP domain-containing sensor histidine kinase [Chloroflexota bacterium]|nr:HAMP domain-containing sensor histidine kinase [Chloroflexota bacterium]
MPEGLRARLTITFGGLTLLAVAVFALLVTGTLERLLMELLAQDLEAQARLVGGQVGRDLAQHDYRAVERTLVRVDTETTARAIAVDAEGRLAGASELEERGHAGLAADDAGLAPALHGQTVRGVLPRGGPQREVLYVAVPVQNDQAVVGAVRLSYQLQDIEQAIVQLNVAIAAGAAGTAVVAGALAAGFAGAVTTPVRALSRAAQALAAGNLEQRIPIRARGEVGQLVEAFNEMAARLREFEVARREFAADISHELRSLAGAMETAADALASGADREPALRSRLVGGLVSHTSRLARLADDLLELARLEGGRLALSFRPLSLAEVVRHSVSEWSAEAAQRRVQLEVKIAADAIVRGDHERLVQASGNLIENALKYTPAGGWVRIALRPGDGVHHLEIRDNGRGIPAEELPFIFHRFYRVEGRAGEGPGGMGLGLAIVERIVRAHGGTITVTSTVGQGTNFHLRLPAGATADGVTPGELVGQRT